MSELVAVYAGTFDPVTYGHLDIVRRGARLFDRLVVSVARDGEGTLFTTEERVALLRPLVTAEPGVSVAAFDGLVVDHARRTGAHVLLRSIRGPRDYEYELQMAFANRSMLPEVETVFLAPSAATGLISSTLVREVAAMGGDVSAWVPPAVGEALAAKHPPR